MCSSGNSKKDRKTGHFTALQEEKYNDKSIICLPRQDKRVDCIFPQRGAVLGQITAYKKARYYDIATNEVLEPKI